MSKTLADLKTLLESEVPAVNSVPTSAQYERAIKDAVTAFSRKCGLSKFADIDIVSGTATYALEDDFIKMIYLEALTNVDDLIISSSGLIPLSSDWDEEYSIAGGQITFTPTPTYTLTRDYKYKAAWILDGSDIYQTMGDQEAEIIMLMAKSIAYEKQEMALAASGGMKYSLGAVSVDKGSGSESLGKKVGSLKDDFDDACDAYNGAAVYGGI